ncbi:MAG: hypothetical protein AB7U24_02400 [Sulfurimonadaceae bacterium]
MKRAVNLRLEESVIVSLNRLSEELHTTKTDVIEKAIKLFAKEKKIKQNNLLQYAGALKISEADGMLDAIARDKNSKTIEFDL